MIISISGFIGSGKDTVADYLESVYDFKRQSFANSLKDAVANIFNWDRELLDGRTFESRLWRDQIDPWWSHQLGIPEFTPRWALQNIGTNVFRDHFHDSIWIYSLINKLRMMNSDVVITDTRFKNEINNLRTANAITIKVTRGENPYWYDMALLGANKSQLMALGIHPSEYDWIGSKFDYTIDNSGTKEHTYEQIDQILNDLTHP